MSCFHKRPKRSEEEERAFQEHTKKVAQENGKLLGKSFPTPLSMGLCVWHDEFHRQTDARLCANISQNLQRLWEEESLYWREPSGSLLPWSYEFFMGIYRFQTDASLWQFSVNRNWKRKATLAWSWDSFDAAVSQSESPWGKEDMRESPCDIF